MSVSESIIKKIESLTPEQQREVENLVDSLAQTSPQNRPHKSLLGLCADPGIHITEEDIAEARKEMWGNFPREDFDEGVRCRHPRGYLVHPRRADSFKNS